MPLQNLLSRTPKNLAKPVVADVGCGDGFATSLLRQHWPAARIISIDKDKAKLRSALSNSIDSNVSFVHKEVGTAQDIFGAHVGVNVVFCNASLHRLPTHETLVPEVWKMLPPGGIFAAQIPHHDAGFHALLAECLSQTGLPAPASKPVEELPKPHAFYNLVYSQDLENFESWSTEHYHYFKHDELLDTLLSETCHGDLETVSELQIKNPSDYKALQELFAKRYTEQHGEVAGKKVGVVMKRFYFVATKAGQGSTLVR
eukprot:TRINITY_DN7803_c0_g1_i1.p1 TRINITY_DN7803_c0_g1~~TRINITY_DN7803_c0_g1_i1.p1  ORF type:complete len:292 (+),score=81.21 TRINITY_DN7803_c0_g1_i1:103-876(+)